MANIKQTKDKALATINAALAILNKFPDLGEADISLSVNASMNPFEFLLDLFKNTAGYNFIIELLARYIAYEIPVLEAAVKAFLISQLKDMLSCSVNPFLTEEILKNGVAICLDDIDIADVLKYSPFDDKVGKYFYFGTEGLIVDDLVKCNDMDAFIWFMVNRANRRYSWKPKKYRSEPDALSSDNWEEKRKKRDGIITLEYYEKAENLRDAYGGDYEMQTPYNNVLHVFIGDARENPKNISELIDTETALNTTEGKINELNNEIENKEYKKEELETNKSQLDEQLSNQEITKEEYEKNNGVYVKQLNDLNNKLNEKYAALGEEQKKKQSLDYKIGKIDVNALAKGAWDTLTGKNNRNYYYGHTLVEFNVDYIMSLQFYEEKVLAARLLEALTGILTIDLNLSYKQQLIKNEVKKMVSMVVETDDTVVSDCFFTFSNDTYDAMSQQAELRKAGLLSIDGSEGGAVRLNAEDILNSLNEINADTNKETVQTIISGAITNLSKELTQTSYEDRETINFGLQINFIENLLNSLAFVLVSAVLSPKVYLLILINLKILGRETNFNLEDFIASFKQLLVALIRMIRDMLLEYLVKELMKIVEKLVKEVAYKLTMEQVKYYARLIKRVIDCFKRNRYNLDFNIDDVDYADIISSDEEPVDAEC